MKKTLIIGLTVATMLSMAACGYKEDKFLSDEDRCYTIAMDSAEKHLEDGEIESLISDINTALSWKPNDKKAKKLDEELYPSSLIDDAYSLISNDMTEEDYNKVKETIDSVYKMVEDNKFKHVKIKEFMIKKCERITESLNLKVEEINSKKTNDNNKAIVTSLVSEIPVILDNGNFEEAYNKSKELENCINTSLDGISLELEMEAKKLYENIEVFYLGIQNYNLEKDKNPDMYNKLTKMLEEYTLEKNYGDIFAQLLVNNEYTGEVWHYVIYKNNEGRYMECKMMMPAKYEKFSEVFGTSSIIDVAEDIRDNNIKY